MSEIANLGRNDMRWQLLVTASIAALLASAYDVGEAEAAGSDSDRPQVWIELGGQLESMTGSPERPSPPFIASITQPNLLSALDVQRPLAYSIGEEAKFTLQPNNSNWVFSASIQYGRSNGTRHRHQQTANKLVPMHVTVPIELGPKYYYPSRHVKFADGRAGQNETHMVLDFEAGKDVGLGMFGERGASVFSAGVRIAQFTSKSNVILRGEPDLQYPTAPITTFNEWLSFRSAQQIRFHDYAAAASSQTSFHGVGPSVSWNASVPFAGDDQAGEITFDWGLNAAVLFGRQKASGHHQTTAKAYHLTAWNRGFYQYQKNGKPVDEGSFGNAAFQEEGGNVLPTSQHTTSVPHNRSRIVTVPNLGAFAGISMRYSDIKLSVGYRADFFFGAMDGGIDTHNSENVDFHGPFAALSVGLP